MTDPSIPLQDSQQERFACELAKGASQSDAYELAGFKAHTGNASRLRANESVSQRVAWLKTQAASAAVLSIREKREFIARVVRAHGKNLDWNGADADLIQGVKLDKFGNEMLEIPDKLAAMKIDNDLAVDGAEAGSNNALADALARIKAISHA